MMCVAGVVATLFIALAQVPRARGEGFEWLPSRPFIEGEQTFKDKGCAGCHGVLGKAAGPGSDLARGGAGRDVMQLASSFWNHAPIMSRMMMNEQGSKPATLSPDEAGKLAGYLFELNFLDRPGDVERGRVVFERRSCVRCHQLGGSGGAAGPRLDELRPYATALFLAQALWSHGPQMVAKMNELGIERRQLEPDDVDHLLAFLRGKAVPSQSLDQVAAQTGSPRVGKAVFASKGCGRCHALGGVGGGVGPDLGKRRPEWRLAAVVAALWNHGPTMWEQMRALGMTVPQVTDREMADLLAYLYFVQYANIDGDAAKGAAVFRGKSCASCHAGERASGPTLTESEATRSPLHWASAMWNHAPAVAEEFRARGLAWPRIEDDEMRDLVAFLRARGTP